MRNERGMTLLEFIIVAVVILFLIIILWPGCHRHHDKGYVKRLICATNLRGLGNAIYVYAFDYEDVGPVLGWQGSQWGSTTSGWDEKERDFTVEGGTTTVASSLYLLVRYTDVSPKSFVCPDSDETAFENPTSLEDIDLWDFGPNPKKHVSYSYQWPYGEYPATTSGRAGKALMADKNPWFDGKLAQRVATEENYLDTVGLIDLAKKLKGKANIKVGNSRPHERDGQNVLFGDGHVSFEKRADVGVDKDNIYTIGGATEMEKRIGTAPVGMEFDAFDENDSLLINDR